MNCSRAQTAPPYAFSIREHKSKAGSKQLSRNETPKHEAQPHYQRQPYALMMQIHHINIKWLYKRKDE